MEIRVFFRADSPTVVDLAEDPIALHYGEYFNYAKTETQVY